MAQIPRLTAFLETQLGCSGEEAAPIAIKLDEAGFRLGMLSAGSITADDLITHGGLKPLEAAAVMAGADSVTPVVAALGAGGPAAAEWRQSTPTPEPLDQAAEDEWPGREPPAPEPVAARVPVEYRQSTPTPEPLDQAAEVEWLGGEPPEPEPVVYSPSQQTPDPEVAKAYCPTLPSYEPSPYPSPKRRRSESTGSTE